MKISIDTKEDSRSEIRKVISMLQALVGSEEKIYSNKDIFSDSSQEITPSASKSSGDVFGNLFDSDKNEAPDDKEESDSSDEDVEVVPY